MKTPAEKQDRDRAGPSTKRCLQDRQFTEKTAARPVRLAFEDNRAESLAQRALQAAVSQRPGTTFAPRGDRTDRNAGLPDGLKAGIESLSGIKMSDVRVHYNSSEPAQLNALACTQGRDIHVAPGQEKHLPHEGWHAVQQKQGRVRPTMQVKGTQINDDSALEKEADVMGNKALALANQTNLEPVAQGLRYPPAQESAARGSANTSSVVQRLVGFEAEFRVPTFGLPQGEAGFLKRKDKVTDKIKRFVFGGLPYSWEIGKSKEFGLTADHNGNVGRIKIIKALQSREYLSNTAKPKDTTSNLEYVTPPVDELEKGSDKRFDDQARTLKNHMAETLASAKRRVMEELPRPAGPGYYSGIPQQDLMAWLEPGDYNIVRPLIKNYVANQVKDEILLQATVGIIPSAMPALHRQAKKKAGRDELNTPKVRKMMFEAPEKTVSQLSNRKEFKDHPYIKKMKGIDRDAFKGILQILFMYIVGDTLHRTSLGIRRGFNVKSAVPFLIKMEPYNIIDAGTRYLRDKPVPKDLKDIIAGYFKASDYAKPEHWVKVSGKGQETRTPKEKLIEGSYAEFIKVALGGPFGQHPLVVRGKKTLPKPDELPPPVKRSTAGQAAIPVEYRWIKVRPTKESLAGEMKKIIKEVRMLNTRHMPDKQRDQLLSDMK